MKNLRLLTLLLLIAQLSFAQSTDQCRKIVDLTIESINNSSAAQLSASLSDDFVIAGQKGEIAKMVLNQLLAQLGESVKSHKETHQNKSKKTLELKYDIEYETMGSREATFVFDEDNLLKELDLFTMEVKTLEGESQVIKNTKDIIEIPFEMAGNLIMVDVLLNGKKRKFILDSGSPRVILNSAHISKNDAEHKTISSSEGVGGSISGMNIDKVESLDFSGIQLNKQEVITLDLSHLKEELGHEFYGLIGFEMIKDYDVIFDYEKQILTLITPNTYETYKNENFPNNQTETIPFELHGHIPIIKAEIDNKILTFGIDCGGEVNLIDESMFQALEKSTCKIETDELVGADNNKIEVKKGNIKKMTIGNKIFKKTPTVYSDISHLNTGHQINLDGLVGYPFLSQQKTIISFNRKELIFVE